MAHSDGTIQALNAKRKLHHLDKIITSGVSLYCHRLPEADDGTDEEFGFQELVVFQDDGSITIGHHAIHPAHDGLPLRNLLFVCAGVCG